MHKCDQCGREATVHELTVVNGVKAERHLCEACAAREGIDATGHPMASAAITKLMVPPAVAMALSRSAGCAACGMTFADFKQHGLLGCPRCYEAFEQQLAPMIERAQEGATKHSGKVPRRLCNAAKGTTAESLSSLENSLQERAARLRVIREQLAEAVRTEQYERAARLRDELRNLDPDTRAPGRGPG